MKIEIRNEIEADYRRVEEITREAFWNLYVPGCCEHYLAHVMRTHKDFIANLDYVALVDGKLVGNIMFARSSVVNEKNEAMEILTFGPVSVLPEYQKMGIGSSLIQHTILSWITHGDSSRARRTISISARRKPLTKHFSPRKRATVIHRRNSPSRAGRLSNNSG